MREFQILGCVDAGGVIRRKFLFTRIEIAGLSLEGARTAGFTLADDGGHYVREITPEVIAHETRDEDWTDTVLFAAKVEYFIGGAPPRTTADFPADATFRDAWILNGDKVEPDMVQARDIKRDLLRAERSPLLAALDIEYQRADEAGDKARKTMIAAKKQALRDVPDDPAIEAATTPEELKAVRPVAL